MLDKNPAVAGMDRPFVDVTRSPAVAGMADSWPHINITNFRNHDLEMTPYNSTEVKGQGVILLIGQW